MKPPRTVNEAWCRALVDELVHHGLRHAVVAPGSRSTPLALALAEAAIDVSVVVDERSAAFMALGLAKGGRAPVLVLCTSGSAGAHFLPALIEAHATRVPLIVVTADRPPELHGFGAHQAIDQTRLFGAYAEFVDLGAPHASPEALRHVRALAARAMGTGGVVHWNAPFREPLAAPIDDDGALDGAIPLEMRERLGSLVSTPAKSTTIRAPQLRAAPATVDHVRRALENATRPLFIVGPLDDPGVRAPLMALARKLGAPVLAEVSSSLRDGADDDVIVAHAELIVRAGDVPMPDVVVRLGGTPTTRALLAFADRCPRTLTVGAGVTPDPSHAATTIVFADTGPFLLDVLAEHSAADVRAEHSVADVRVERSRGELGWLRRWKELDARAAEGLARVDARRTEKPALDEPAIARAVVASVAPGDLLFLASSMPIRDAEAFAGSTAADVRVVVNRGACGIDGLISTAAGVALASRRETTLLCGDLALLHDVGGLVAARTAAAKGARLRIVVVNNDGGGIFSFLPVAERTSPATFTDLFATPHGLTFAAVARFVGAEYAEHDTLPAFRTTLASLRPAPNGGLVVVEARTDRLANRAVHDEVIGVIAAALAPGGTR